MRNIVARIIRQRLVTNRSEPRCTCLVLNEDDGKEYYVQGHYLQCHRMGDEKGGWSLDFSRYTTETTPSLAAALWHPQLQVIVLAVQSGELLLVRDADRTVEEVGAFTGGILAAAWSPTGETMAVLTGEDKLIVLTQDWSVLAEIQLDRQSHLAVEAGDCTLCWRGDAQYLAVSVPSGLWIVETVSYTVSAVGSEAQWNTGPACWQPNNRNLYVAQAVLPSAASAPDWARGTTMGPNASGIAPNAYPEINSAGTTTKPARVPLRPDAATATALSRKVLEGKAQSHGPHLDGAILSNSTLEHSNRGVQGAGVAVHDEGTKAQPGIGLVETNALPHGGFWVQPDCTDQPCSAITSMSWSPDSSLLAVVLHGTNEATGSSTSKLQVWHRSNWHWYLQFEWQSTDTAATPPLSIAWGAASQAPVLHVLSSRGLLSTFEFTQQRCVSQLGTVALIDGCAINVTPLRQSVVPPPMAGARLVYSSVVQHAVWGYSHGAEVLMTILANGSVAIIQADKQDIWEDTVEQLSTAEPAPSGMGCSQTAVPCTAFSWLCLGAASSEALAFPVVVTHAVWLQENLVALVTAQLCTAVESHQPRQLVTAVGAMDREWVWSIHVLAVSKMDMSGPAAAHGQSTDTDHTAQTAAGGAMERAKWMLQRVASLRLPGQVVHCVAANGAADAEPAAWLCLADCTVVKLHGIANNPGTWVVSAAAHAALSEDCACVAAIPLLGIVGQHTVIATHDASTAAPLVGLSHQGNLWWGKRLVATDATSFLVDNRSATGPLLLWVDRSSMLHIHALHELRHSSIPAANTALGNKSTCQPSTMKSAMHQAMRPFDQPLQTSSVPRVPAALRRLEEGSMLLASPAGTNNLVLHLPRGNLETISPRAFVLPAIAALLHQHDYATAWQLVCCHRVDANIIVDYQWPVVLHHTKAVVQALQTPLNLCDLLGTLREDNVLDSQLGLYGEVQRLLAPHLHANSARKVEDMDNDVGMQRDKVGRVCRALRSAMEEIDSVLYFVAILTSFVAEGDFGTALQRIKLQREMELQGPMPVLAEAGVKHLLASIDSETLYRASLRAYLLDVAYLVVSCSSKDPQEHLLQLQGFEAAGNVCCVRAAVDMHLEQWSSAIKHLVQGGAHDEAHRLASDKGLLAVLVQCYPESAPQRAGVLQAYADDLMARSKHEDAALVCIAARSLEKALVAYRAAGCWQQAMSVSKQLNLSATERLRLATDMAAELAAIARPGDAARLLLDFCDDSDGGVMLLCEASMWRTAVYEAYRFDRDDLLETIVHPAAGQRATVLLIIAKEAIERIDKYKLRLEAIQEKRMSMQAVLQVGDFVDKPADDAISVASSIVSGMSVYTTASSPSRQPNRSLQGSSVAPSTTGGKVPHKKKTGKGKGSRIRQGSPCEELQLSQLLQDLGPSSDLLAEVGELLELLVLGGNEATARQLQQRLGSWWETHAAVLSWLQRCAPDQDQPKNLLDDCTSGQNSRSTASLPQWKWVLLRDVKSVIV